MRYQIFRWDNGERRVKSAFFYVCVRNAEREERLRGRGPAPPSAAARLSADYARMSTQKYTAADVAKHNVLEGPNKSTWVIYEGGVYDITKFVSEHPGGTEVLADTAGTDITRSFTEIGHSDHARSLMTPMKVGELVRIHFSLIASPSCDPFPFPALFPRPFACIYDDAIH